MMHVEDRNQVEIFNLGTGKGVSVLELITTFEKSTGVKIPYSIVGRREGDIEKVWAEPTKANQILGWKADTPLDQVLISAWEWEKKIRNIKE
jgi:UDP-glucose 4-epimerase